MPSGKVKCEFKTCKLSFLDELSREEDVLEWLIENKSTGDDEDVIEEVSAKTLGTLIQNIDNLVVVFCKFCGSNPIKNDLGPVAPFFC